MILEEVAQHPKKTEAVLIGMDIVAGTVNDLLGKLMNEPNGKQLTKEVAKEVSAKVKKKGNEKYFAMVILITGGII